MANQLLGVFISIPAVDFSALDSALRLFQNTNWLNGDSIVFFFTNLYELLMQKVGPQVMLLGCVALIVLYKMSTEVIRWILSIIVMAIIFILIVNTF